MSATLQSSRLRHVRNATEVHQTRCECRAQAYSASTSPHALQSPKQSSSTRNRTAQTRQRAQLGERRAWPRQQGAPSTWRGAPDP
eukprot:2099788-Rhodomonas_salina.5